LTLSALRMRVEVPDPWSPGDPQLVGDHVELMVHGPGEADGLLLQYMGDADPGADLGGWAQAPVHLTGMAGVSVALGDGELVEWGEIPGAVELVAAWKVDEARVFEGETATARVVHVVARRGREAWNVGLSIESEEASAPDVLGSLAFGQE
jgi:hypothetical protein